MLFKINTNNLTDLSSHGISPATINLLEKSKKAGTVFKNPADLAKIGIPKNEVKILTETVSFSPPENESKLVSASFITEPTGLFGYIIVVEHNDNSGNAVTDLYHLEEYGSTTIVYNEKIAVQKFYVSIKGPGGEITESIINNKKALRHEVDKAALNNLKIKIIPSKKITAGKTSLIIPTKIKGRLLANSGLSKSEKIQIIFFIAVYVDANGNPEFYPVCYAETETNGYFFSSSLTFRAENDYKNIISAKAVLNVEGNPEINIRLNYGVGEGAEKGSLPDKVILFLQDQPNVEAITECDCDCKNLDFHQKKVLEEFSYHTVVRTTEPLIKATEISYAQEVNLEDIMDDINIDPQIKNTLTGLRVPKLMLHNFLAKNKTLSKTNANKLVLEAQAYALKKKVSIPPQNGNIQGRLSLSADSSVDWDEDPTIYEAITISHGHLLSFKQEWFSDGYSLGDLLYSLPLAPGQKKQIVVFDWDRKDSASNTQQLDYQETLYNSLGHDRIINEVANATVSEKISGESEASTWGVGGAIGGVISGVVFGVAGGYGAASSSASQSASRNATASSQQQVHDKTVQAANVVRSQRATVVQSVSQGERFEVSAETVANYNHCHAITIQYFEVLRHFEITTRLSHVQECLFIPLSFSPFDRKKTLRWRNILSASLKKKALGKGFIATERIEEELESDTEDYYTKIGFPQSNNAEFEVNYVEGELYLEFDFIRPLDKDGAYDPDKWNWLTFIIGNPEEFYKKYLQDKTEKDEIFFKYAGPAIAKEIVDSMVFYAGKSGSALIKLPLEATLLSTFRNKIKLNLTLRQNGDFASSIKRNGIDFIEMAIENADLNELFKETVKVIIHSGSVRYRTDHTNEYLFRNAVIKNDLTPLGDNVRVYTPLNKNELRNPRNEDVEASNSLLRHLNENLEYYHRMIWMNMDDQRRFMLLDGILAPGKANGRSVASVVENKLIGIVGNCLVMPVAPGFQLDPTLDDNVDLYQHYYADPLDPIRISLPTKGVFAEAVMGKCNSCEKKDETRFWRWEESPIPDDPTTINPISTPVPQNTQPSLEAKDFPAPIVNIQNAPALPDPQGYGALTTMLSNPNLFRDVTGLAANQANAMGAFNSSLAAAQNVAGMAKELESQKLNLKNSDAIADAIRNSGLPKDVQDKLMEAAIQQKIDGGASKKAEQEAENKKSGPTAMGIAEENASQGKPVKASTTDAAGNTETVEVGAGKPNPFENILAEAKGYFQNIQQLKVNDCWAVASTIMMGWKKAKKLTVEEVLTEAGEPYLIKYNENDTLRASEKDGFIEALNMMAEPPASYPLQDYIDMIKAYGPLWITTDAAEEDGVFSPHARILFKITGTDVANGSDVQFYFKDPAIKGDQAESFEDFLKKYEQLVTDDVSDNLILQIVHFKDLMGEGEGGSFNSTQAWNNIQSLTKFNYENLIIRSLESKKTDTWFKNKYNTMPSPHDRGPLTNCPGFISALTLIYARIYARLKNGEKFSLLMAENLNSEKSENNIDVLKRLIDAFNKVGISTFSTKELRLRSLFTLLLGLGIQESSGKYSEGTNLDPGESWVTKPAVNCEAGVFQISHSIGVGNKSKYPNLYTIYRLYMFLGKVNTFLDFFTQVNGVKIPTAHHAKNETVNDEGYLLQEFIYTNPGFSIELTALGVRERASHWGPFNKNPPTAIIKKEYYDLLSDVEKIMDADTDSKAIGFVRASWNKIYAVSSLFSLLQIQSSESGLWILGLQNGTDFRAIDLLFNGGLEHLDLTGEDVFLPDKVYIDYNDTVWIIDTQNRIWNNKDGGYFRIFTNQLAKDIAIDSDGIIWIISLENEDSSGFDIKKCINQSESDVWETTVETKGNKIFVDMNKDTWVINESGDLYFNQKDSSILQNITLPSRMNYTSGNIEIERVTDLCFDANNNLWIIGGIETINNNFSIYRYNNGSTISEWVSYDGAGVAIEIDHSDGLPIILNAKGEINKLKN